MLLKDIQKVKSLVSDQYIGRKLSDKELLQIEELKVPLSRLHLFEGFIKNNDVPGPGQYHIPCAIVDVNNYTREQGNFNKKFKFI